MKYLILSFLLLLSGCWTVPVKHPLPEPPLKLIEKCPQLKSLPDDEERLSELMKTVIENYSTYYDCAVKHDGLVEWYQIQKKIHDDVFNK